MKNLNHVHQIKVFLALSPLLGLALIDNLK